MNRHVAAIASTSLALASQAAVAQIVVVGFNGGATTAVPISPWASAATALVLAFLSFRMLKKKSSTGLFLALLAMISGSAAIYISDADAVVPVLTLIGSSPVSSPDLGLGSCNSGSVTVQNGPSTATLTSIQVNGVARLPAAVWTISTFQTGDCQVGAPLAPTSTCLVQFSDPCS
jgi:hypothetical protein